MEQTNMEQKCAHSPCRCSETNFGGYCSEHCRDARDAGPGEECRCGHSECA